MRKYELTYLISDKVQESDLNKVTGKISGVIGELGGKVAKEEIWGRRKLAYPIQKQDFATYVTLNFNLPALSVITLEREIKLTDGILRHLLIVKDMGDEEITLTADEIAGTNDIEAVIGGEKSFEAVVGETKESKNLMAKREEEKSSETLVASNESKEEDEKESAVEIETKSDESAFAKAAEDDTKAKEVKKSRAKKETAEPVKSEESFDIAQDKKAEEPKKEKAAAKKSLDKVQDKPAKKPLDAARDKAAKEDSEVERLSKLNDELDDILKDEL